MNAQLRRRLVLLLRAMAAPGRGRGEAWCYLRRKPFIFYFFLHIEEKLIYDVLVSGDSVLYIYAISQILFLIGYYEVGRDGF